LPPRTTRPLARKGDRLVFAYGERAGQVIGPEDLPLGGPQQLAFPMDPVTKIVRDGSPLNQVALIRLDPAQLSADTRTEAAGGVVAYSAVCTHEGCPISMWHKDSKSSSARATRLDSIRPIARASSTGLPATPGHAALGPIDRGIVAAGGFTGRVGRQTT